MADLRDHRPSRRGPREKVAARWWKSPEGEAHGEVWATLKRVRELSSTRLEFDRHHI